MSSISARHIGELAQTYSPLNSLFLFSFLLLFLSPGQQQQKKETLASQTGPQLLPFWVFHLVFFSIHTQMTQQQQGEEKKERKKQKKGLPPVCVSWNLFFLPSNRSLYVKGNDDERRFIIIFLFASNKKVCKTKNNREKHVLYFLKSQSDWWISPPRIYFSWFS